VAGHKRQTGITRCEHRARWWRREIESAATPGDQLATAVRWLRAAASRADPGQRDRVLRAAAQKVADQAAELERILYRDRGQ
jgi:hypothetical protein